MSYPSEHKRMPAPVSLAQMKPVLAVARLGEHGWLEADFEDRISGFSEE